ncbi:MAG: mannose-1-phosphate guanylyltransferase, partial [Candidatus Paceibacterota bacterium]
LVTQVIPIERLYIMAVPEYTDIILEQVPALLPENILFEPAQRDNGPAVTLGMLQVAARDPEALVASLWSDHLILDEEAFATILIAAFEAAEANPDALVNVGTKPTKPDPSLGYIQMGEKAGTYNNVELHQVKRFVEKPDEQTAVEYFTSGEYLWNAGYNVMSALAYITQLKEVQPEHVATIDNLEKAVGSGRKEDISSAYAVMPKLSIDYLFVQKISKILVVPADMGWSDIGTWSTLHRMMVTKSGAHMYTQGEVHSIKTENCLVFAKDRPITLVGVKDLIVVDTGDTLLVMHHDASASDLKSLVQDTLTTTNPELL